MSPTDDTPDDCTTALATALEARDQLNGIDLDALDEPHRTYVWNAIEMLDNVMLDVDTADLAAAGAATDADTEASAGDETQLEGTSIQALAGELNVPEAEVRRAVHALDAYDDVDDHPSTEAQGGGSESNTSGEPVRGPGETPEDVVMQRLNDAGAGETVPVTLEFTPAIVEMIDIVRGDDETVTEWVQDTVELRLVSHDQQFWNSVSQDVEVELPPEAARWMQLWEEHFVGDEDDAEMHRQDYVDLEFEWSTDDDGE